MCFCVFVFVGVCLPLGSGMKMNQICAETQKYEQRFLIINIKSTYYEREKVKAKVNVNQNHIIVNKTPTGNEIIQHQG